MARVALKVAQATKNNQQQHSRVSKMRPFFIYSGCNNDIRFSVCLFKCTWILRLKLFIPLAFFSLSCSFFSHGPFVCSVVLLIWWRFSSSCTIRSTTFKKTIQTHKHTQPKRKPVSTFVLCHFSTMTQSSLERGWFEVVARAFCLHKQSR